MSPALRRLSPVMRAGFVLTFLLGALGTGCGEERPRAWGEEVELSIEPQRLVFHPQTEPIAVELVNRGDAAVAVGNFALRGPDWASFSIVEPLDPTLLEPGQSLRFHVAVDAESLKGPLEPAERDPLEALDIGSTREETPEEDPDAFREGDARLTFDAGEASEAIPVRFEEPSWLWGGLLPAIAKILALVLAFIMPLASLLTWMERKQSAMMQDRVGPNMARISIGPVTLRLWGLLHIATDGLKMLFKEDFIPRRAHRQLYSLAPLMAFIPALVVFAIVPFGDGLCYGMLFDTVSQADVDQCSAGRGGTALQIARLDVGLLYYFAIASLATYGTTLAGWASYNKWAILGSLRASAQMISYEVAIGLTIVGALLVYGSLEPHAIVRAQLETHWGIILQPVAFILFFTAAIAETKRAPFDLPEGESEIIGYFLEYSGMRFGLFFLAEFIEIVFVSALVATLFLGGWALPFNILGPAGFSSPLAAQLFFAVTGIIVTATGAAIWRASKHAESLGMLLVLLGTAHITVAIWSVFTGWGTAIPHIAVVAIWLLTWGIKVLVLCWVQLLIRWTLPRFRYDQLMSLGWKGLLPLSIANIVLTAIVVYLLAPHTPQQEAAAAAARTEIKAQ